MARDIILNKTGSVTGSGAKTLGFSWGANTSRVGISKTYSVSGGSNSLLVNQSAADLAISIVGQTVITVNPESLGPITFRGHANGRYIGASAPNVAITLTERMSATSQSSAYHVDEFTVTMSAYSVADGETVSKTREGLDGTDVIN